MWPTWKPDITSAGGVRAPDGSCFIGPDGTVWEDEGELWSACFAGHLHDELQARGPRGRLALIIGLERSLRASVPERFHERVRRDLEAALWYELELLPILRAKR